jgi:hypothetical protein
MEGSRLLHDLLPRRTAEPAARIAGGGEDRRRVALVFLPPRHLSAADADDAVRAGERDDQLVQAGRPPLHPDEGRADNASSLLLYYVYQVAFSFFDTGYAATLTVVLLVLLALLAVVQFLLIEKRVHYR